MKLPINLSGKDLIKLLGVVIFHILLVTCFIVSCTPEKAKEANDFVQIFDGETLNRWVGDEPYWSVENGAIVGRITDSTMIDRNRFLIYQGDIPADFELKVEYRVSEHGNSGINYRSELVEGLDFHALKGYQCDIDGPKNYVGSNYEERIRRTLAKTGEITEIPNAEDAGSLKYAEKNRWTIREIKGQTGTQNELLGAIKDGDWNEVHLIVQGNRMKHYINGQLMSDVTDNDTINRRMDGQLGVQVHMGPPMTIEYRNFRVRELK